MRHPIQFHLKRYGDLLLDFLGGVSRPLGDGLGVGIGDVGIGFDGQIVKGNDAPEKQHQRAPQHQQAVAQGKINQGRDHSLFSAMAVEN